MFTTRTRANRKISITTGKGFARREFILSQEIQHYAANSSQKNIVILHKAN
jgi:hypothetical protein